MNRAGRLLPPAVLVAVIGVTLVLPVGLVGVQLAAAGPDVATAVAGSWSATVRSVLLAVTAAALSLPLAVVVARSLSRARPAIRLAGVVVCGAPVVLNLLVIILAWMMVLERDGLVPWLWRAAGLGGEPPALLFTTPATVVAMVYVVAPVMVLALLSGFREADPRMHEAARLLGASAPVRFVLVELGHALPSLISSFLLGYLISLNLYLLPEYLTGPELTTLGLLVQQDVITSFDLGAAAARAVVLLLTALVPAAVLVAAEWRVRPR